MTQLFNDIVRKYVEIANAYNRHSGGVEFYLPREDVRKLSAAGLHLFSQEEYLEAKLVAKLMRSELKVNEVCEMIGCGAKHYQSLEELKGYLSAPKAPATGVEVPF